MQEKSEERIPSTDINTSIMDDSKSSADSPKTGLTPQNSSPDKLNLSMDNPQLSPEKLKASPDKQHGLTTSSRTSEPPKTISHGIDSILKQSTAPTNNNNNRINGYNGHTPGQ